MSRRISLKRHVDPEVFKEFIKSKGLSIRQLEMYCDCSEKTIRRALQQESISLNVALDICQHFKCNFNDIFGPDESDKWKEAVIFTLQTIR